MTWSAKSDTNDVEQDVVTQAKDLGLPIHTKHEKGWPKENCTFKRLVSDLQNRIRVYISRWHDGWWRNLQLDAEQ